MKSHIIKLFAAVTVILATSAHVVAQEKGTTGLVTVLDVAKVFEQNPEFKQQMDAIKAEADTLKKSISERQNQIRQEAQELQNYEIGSPERNQKEAALAQKQTNLATEARQKEQQLLNREAMIYFETYKTMQSVVAATAASNNISLVLRYDSSAIEKTNRAEVIKGVNRTVVYHKQLDLTSMVIKSMNQRTASASGGNPIR